MSRTVVLLSVLLLTLPTAGWAAGADDDEDARATAYELSETAEAPAETGEPVEPEETAELDEMPVYVPPQRGAPPVRVGGATRGGQPRRRPL